MQSDATATCRHTSIFVKDIYGLKIINGSRAIKSLDTV